MLRLAERGTIEDFDAVASPRLFEAKPPVTAPDQAYPAASSTYGAGKPINLPAILLILLAHAALIFILVQARQHVIRQKEERLSVVNLLTPPPPPAEKAPPPPPSKPEILAPAPVVNVPVVSPPVATTSVQVPITPRSVNVDAPPVNAPPAPAAPPSIVQGGDLGAQMVSGSPPRYPIESRRKREQGTVVLTLTLGVDGAVDSIAIAQSSGFSRLDKAALDAVRRWRWRPVIRNGQPARVSGVVEIPFVIQEK